MKITLCSIALMSICALKTFAQDPEPLSRSVFKLSPQHFIHNSLKVGLERFNPTHASSFTFFVTGMMENTMQSYGEGYNGVAGELQLRKYISPMKSQTSRHNKTYHQGVYGALYLQGGHFSDKFKGESGYIDPVTGAYVTEKYDYSEKILNGGLGFTIGYQKTLWQVIFIEGFVGGGIQFAGRKLTGAVSDYRYYYQGIVSPLYEGILPKIGMNIGIGL
jgi:hypothetical protein